MGVPALQVLVSDRPRHFRHALEWLDVLRAPEPPGGSMSRTPTSAAAAAPTAIRIVRCAVCTRKSTDEGLEKEFNSLDAQRESCEAYIASQRPEGWVLVPDYYDDSGISGGTLERLALQRLLRDIEADWIDTVVVCKIDRLSRSLMQFAKLVETFDAHDVTFVSVTQSFNTTPAWAG